MSSVSEVDEEDAEKSNLISSSTISHDGMISNNSSTKAIPTANNPVDVAIPRSKTDSQKAWNKGNKGRPSNAQKSGSTNTKSRSTARNGTPSKSTALPKSTASAQGQSALTSQSPTVSSARKKNGTTANEGTPQPKKPRKSANRNRSKETSVGQ